MSNLKLPIQIGGCPLATFGMAFFMVTAFNLVGFLMLQRSAMDSSLGWTSLIVGIAAFAGAAILLRKEEEGR